MIAICAAALFVLATLDLAVSDSTARKILNRGPANGRNLAICLEAADATALSALAKKYNVKVETQIDKLCPFVLLPNRDSVHELPPVYSSSSVKTIITNKCVIDYRQDDNGLMKYAIAYYLGQKPGSRAECFATLVRSIRLGPSAITK